MRKLLLFSIIALFALGLNAQKVGLVLSGGGAKGAAHVGVIKALEEHQIPIDYITGTSFGAIVGAMYASGYTPNEMAMLLQSKKFMQWVYGKIKEADQYYYKKEEPSPSWFHFQLEKNKNPLKTMVPSSLFENHQLDLRLMEMLAPASAASDYLFDSLMVPFRCVATDVYHNKSKMLKNGNLTSAVRASITFPLIFKPIQIDGTLYMDGGMKNNFPSGIMKQEFAPDVIIGSKVAFNNTIPEPNDIFSQIENIFADNTNFSLPDSTLLIEPAVREFSAYDFERIDSLIELGYKATFLKIETISGKIEARQTAQNLKTKRNEFISKKPKLVFNKVIIKGLKPPQQRYVKRQIMANQDTFTFKTFEKEYFRLLSDNKIKEIYPKALYNPYSNYYELHLDITVNYNIEVELGGQINTTSKNFAYLGANYKYLGKRAYDLSGSLYYGKMYSSMKVKGGIDFPYFHNNKGHRLFPLFVDATVNYSRRDYFNSTREWFFEDATPSYITRSDAFFQWSLGIPLATNGFLSAGNTLGASVDNYYQTNIIKREDDPDITRFNYASMHGKYEYSTLNRKQFATEGTYYKLMYRFVNGREKYYPGTTAENTGLKAISQFHQYSDIELNVRKYQKITNKLTIGGDARLFYTEKDFFSNYISTQLACNEYKPIPYTILFYLPNFRSYTYASIGIMPIVKFTDNLALRLEAHLYQPYKKINYDLYKPVYEKPFEHQHYIGNTSLVYQSFMGPVYLSFSYLDRNNNSWFMHFGFGFLILNPRGLD